MLRKRSFVAFEVTGSLCSAPDVAGERHEFRGIVEIRSPSLCAAIGSTLRQYANLFFSVG